jgi:hypothetical protein
VKQLGVLHILYEQSFVCVHYMLCVMIDKKDLILLHIVIDFQDVKLFQTKL